MNNRLFGRIGLCAVLAFGMAAECAALTLTVTPSSPYNLGDSVTLTAHGLTNSKGNVTFYDGANVIAVVPVPAANTVSFSTTQLPAGTQTLKAYYDFKMTTATTQVTVTPKKANAFLPPKSYEAGFYPVSAAVGSFDASMKSELAVANWGNGTVSVLLAGLTPGTFKAPVNYKVGYEPHAVALGDFGNGHTDIAVANMGGNVSILLNNGSGTFSSAVNYPAGPTPYALAVADLNGDGKADIAVVNENAGITVLLGNGDGTFQAPLPTDTDVMPTSIFAFDFNNDGIPDLAVTNSSGGANGLNILIGNGDGTFLLTKNYAVGTRPYAITGADFNNDKQEDLVVTDYAGLFWFLTGNGDGTFNLERSYTVGNVPDAVTAGDFDGDGNADLAVANAYDNTVSIFLGNGIGDFTFAVNYPTEPGLPSAIVVSDFNGDKRSDIAVANFYIDDVQVFLGDKFTITIAQGNGQSALINNFFPMLLEVIVKNSSLAPVVGTQVTFTAPASAASLTFRGSTSTTVLTKTGGLATAPQAKANGIAGFNYPVTATVGFAGVATFLENNLP